MFISSLFWQRRPQCFPNILLLQCREATVSWMMSWEESALWSLSGCITDGFFYLSLHSYKWQRPLASSHCESPDTRRSHRLLSPEFCFNESHIYSYCVCDTTGADETWSSDCHLIPRINFHYYCVCMKLLPFSDDTVCVVSAQRLAVQAHYL